MVYRNTLHGFLVLDAWNQRVVLAFVLFVSFEVKLVEIFLLLGHITVAAKSNLAFHLAVEFILV